MSDARRVVLFRGLNVGRSKRLSMATLGEVLEVAGCRDVRTYLQSGNAVLRCPGDSSDAELEARLGEALASTVGGSVATFVRSVPELRTIVERNPFPEAESAPTTLHVFFFGDEPAPRGIARLAELATASERLKVEERCAYLHAPDGIGRSKLASTFERTVEVPTTARNWRTVTSLLTLAES